MIQQSGDALTSFSSGSIGILPRTYGSWLQKPNWSRRGVWVYVAELALAAVSFLATSAFFGNSSAAYVPAKGICSFFLAAMFFRGIAFKYFGVCDRSFRHAGIPDVIAIGKAVGTSTLALYLTSMFVEFRGGISLPGHMLIGDAITTFLLLSALHFGARIYHFGAERPVPAASSVRRVIIFGAGDAGASVLKELIDSPRSRIMPVAILDDDPKKKGR